MKSESVWVIYKGSYSDMTDIGFCDTEEEAKGYCDLINKGMREEEWNRLFYFELKNINLVRDKMQVYYFLSIYGWGEEIMLCDRNCEISPLVTTNEVKGHISYDNVNPVFDFYIFTNEEQKAKKIAYDMIAQIKEKYEECGDLDLAVSCFAKF